MDGRGGPYSPAGSNNMSSYNYPGNRSSYYAGQQAAPRPSFPEQYRSPHHTPGVSPSGSPFAHEYHSPSGMNNAPPFARSNSSFGLSRPASVNLNSTPPSSPGGRPTLPPSSSSSSLFSLGGGQYQPTPGSVSLGRNPRSQPPSSHASPNPPTDRMSFPSVGGYDSPGGSSYHSPMSSYSPSGPPRTNAGPVPFHDPRVGMSGDRSPQPSSSVTNSPNAPSGMRQMTAEEAFFFHKHREEEEARRKAAEAAAVERQVQERMKQYEKEREEQEAKQRAEFERQWQEREAQWKLLEQQKIQQREEEEKLQRQRRAEEEHKMIEEARRQAKEKAAREMQEQYERRRHQEITDLKQREEALLAILDRERQDREQRERDIKLQQEELEKQVQQQERKRMEEALQAFRIQEKERIRQDVASEFHAEKELQIRQEMQATFHKEAAARQQEYQRQQEHLRQQDELFDCNWKIPGEHLRLQTLVGRGAFGEVYRGQLHGKEVAIKKLLVQNVNETSLKEFRQEISIMSNLRHPNILLFIGACLDPDNICIVTEYMPMGSLQEVLFTKNIQLDMRRRLAILKETAQGMNWLHSLSPPFLHRDLKTGNILLDQNWSVRVADFGLSSVKSLDESGDRVEGPVGSPFYMAPEILLDKPYDAKADVYSFSIVIWETLAHKDPYEGEFETYEDMVEGITIDEMRPAIPSWFPVGVVALLKRCWATDPEERPSFAQILEQSWFDHITVDYYLPAGEFMIGNQFWKVNFLTKHEVPIEEFLPALWSYCTSGEFRNDHPALKIWYSIAGRVSGNGLVIVSITEFRACLAWFGPIRKPSELMERPLRLASSPWFHGQANNADSLLPTMSPGHWMVTQKQLLEDGNFQAEFQVSLLNGQRQVVHLPVYKDRNGKLWYENKSFDSWNDALQEIRSVHPLSQPCPGSPYTPLLVRR